MLRNVHLYGGSWITHLYSRSPVDEAGKMLVVECRGLEGTAGLIKLAARTFSGLNLIHTDRVSDRRH